MSKLAFITGITGQDGSYLAELLLEKKYKVYGIVRRTSLVYTYTRIDHIRKDLNLEYGDLTDGSSLTNFINKIVRDNPGFEVFEIYNLAAQSHVKVSFETAEYTAMVDGLGTLKILEIVKTFPEEIRNKIRFYQAGTSEMYGEVVETPQNEKTPFNPQSPYACAKVYSHYIVKNYREGYGMYACNGILFNHETLAGFMPVIYKQNGIIDIKPISEIVKYNTLPKGVMINEENHIYQEGHVETDLHVWDNSEWTRVIHASGYPHDKVKNNKNPKFVISKNAAYMATGSHEIIMEDDSEVCFENIEIGNKVKLVDFPKLSSEKNEIDDEGDAEKIGLLVGNETKEKEDNNIITNSEIHVLMKKYKIYNEDGTKRVPIQILNANTNIQLKFLEGYNKADGLKKNKCVYEFKNFKTNSATLAQGLLFLLNNTTQQHFNINVENTYKNGKQCLYYSINILSNTRFSMKESENNEVKKIIDMSEYDGWFYDLETESGKFHAGIGKGRIHNSPRRGENFVTMKIINGVKDIRDGKREILRLGNINSLRDWGHSRDYVYGMWLMLQQDKPDDYVLATGKTTSVREFIEKAFVKIGVNIEWEGEGLEEVGKDKQTGKIVVQIDEKFFRPCEVDLLLGDAKKANEKLGWEAKCNLDELIEDMMN